MKEEMEKYIDELYEIHKESSNRMIELTKDNKEILEKLESKVFSHVEDIKWYSKFFMWLQLAMAIIFVGGMFLALLGFKRDFDWKLAITYKAAEEVRETQIEQNEVLKELKGLSKGEYTGKKIEGEEKEQEIVKKEKNPGNKQL
jgi:hypothetical protein